MDYSGKKPEIVNRHTGETTEVELFVMVLGASNYTYVEATMTHPSLSPRPEPPPSPRSAMSSRPSVKAWSSLAWHKWHIASRKEEVSTGEVQRRLDAAFA